MSKEIKIALFVFIGFLAFLSLRTPLLELLLEFGIAKSKAKLIAGSAIRVVLLGALIYIIAKLNLIRFLGLRTGKCYNLQSVLLALVFIGFGISMNWNIYTSLESSTLFLFFLSVILVGFVEEFLFRGIIFPLLLRSFQNKKHFILVCALISSLLFGLTHYINLFSEPDNFYGITSQVFFASAIGVFFVGLVLRTRNILIPSIVHGLVNFAYGAGDLTEQDLPTEAAEEVGEFVLNWRSIIPTTLFFIFIMVGGIYMVNKTSAREILFRLEGNRTTASYPTSP